MPVQTLNMPAPGLMSALPAPVGRALKAAGRKVLYTDGQTIHMRGDLKPGLSIVEKGGARIGGLSAGGEYKMVALLTPGHSFGELTLFANLPRTHDAEAVGDTIILQISRGGFDQTCRRQPGLERLMLASLAQRYHAALEFIDDLRNLPLTARIARLLLAQTGDATRGAVAITQSALAQTLGVSRMAVSTALRALQTQGFLVRRYGEIELPDIMKFRTWLDARQRSSGPSPLWTP